MELRVNSVNGALAARIREAREAVSLSQKELADRFAVSPRTVQNWEAGTASPRPAKRREVLEFIEFVEGVRAA